MEYLVSQMVIQFHIWLRLQGGSPLCAGNGQSFIQAPIVEACQSYEIIPAIITENGVRTRLAKGFLHCHGVNLLLIRDRCACEFAAANGTA